MGAQESPTPTWSARNAFRGPPPPEVKRVIVRSTPLFVSASEPPKHHLNERLDISSARPGGITENRLRLMLLGSSTALPQR